MNSKHSFLYRNGLSLIFLLFMFLSLLGQIYTGLQEHNDFLNDYKQASQTFWQYLGSGHFIEATFENWESEFLQMALFVIFTIFLRQQGSSESKDCNDPSFDAKDLIPSKNSPWSVKKGGIYLAVYKHSLTIVLLLLFLISFLLHWYGSWLSFNEEQSLKQETLKSFSEFIGSSKFWFESFQNWQSEFLSIFAIISLSIYLRQYGSSQSKAVNAAHEKTGEE